MGSILLTPGPPPIIMGIPCPWWTLECRTQSNLGSAFYPPPLPSCQSKWFYIKWGLGRAVGGRERPLRAQARIK